MDAVAGAAGALLALLSTYPLMTLNTRQHTERGAEETLPRRRGGINTHTHTRRRVSMMDELRSVAEEDGGLAGLYRGIEPAVIGTVTSQTVYNYVYASLRVATARIREKKNGAAGLGALESLAIASVAGSINVVLTIPIWTVCVRMQAERANEGEGKVPSPNAALERGFGNGEQRRGARTRVNVFNKASLWILRSLDLAARFSQAHKNCPRTPGISPISLSISLLHLARCSRRRWIWRRLFSSTSHCLPTGLSTSLVPERVTFLVLCTFRAKDPHLQDGLRGSPLSSESILVSQAFHVRSVLSI